jgi:hypothetical protein
MAEDPRAYMPSTTQANRARIQGNGVGQKEMNMQQDPDRDTYATNPQRLEPFGDDPQGGGDDLGADNGRNASGTGNSTGAEERSFASDDDAASDEEDDSPSEGDGGAHDYMGLDPNLGRNAAGYQHAGDLGAGTPANVDIHDIGQSDRPEQEWGEGEPGAVHGQTKTRRPDPTESQRGQGAKTRQLNKDIISRRTEG